MLAKLLAFGTKRLAAGTGAQIFTLNIISGVAVSVVVMNPGLRRMPCAALSHDMLLN